MAMIRTPLIIVGFCSAFIYSSLQTTASIQTNGVCINKSNLNTEAKNLSLVVESPKLQKSHGPYEGWENWCEPVTYDKPCVKHEDCQNVYPDHPAKRPMRCFNPWFAKENPETKVCVPGYAKKSERDWRENRLREIVRQQYFGETEYCILDGRPIHKENWRCQRATKLGDKLTNFLLIPYDRETTRRPFKRHRLDADLRAGRTAWFAHAKDYGWAPKLDKKGYFVDMEKADDDANEAFYERSRWHYGLGPFGQNVTLWVNVWDKQAPPEILCREPVAVETYLRKSREVVNKLHHGIRCSGKYYENKKPTWEVIHRAVSSGKICPATSKEKNAIKKSNNFKKAASKHGINPDEPVTLKMLGAPIPRKNQNDRLVEIYEILEEKWPVAKMRKKQ